MKAKLDSHTKTEAANRDTIIGSAISNAMASASPADQCPTAEQLAVLVDANAAEEERDNLLGHMAVCNRCRDIYLLAHDLSSEEPAQQNHRGWYMAGGTLAAVAMVVLAVKFTIQEPIVTTQQASNVSAQQTQLAQTPKVITSPPAATAQMDQPQETAFTSTIAARQLAKSTSADNLAAAIGAPISGSYGFAGSDSWEATVFRAGKELFELELWLAAGDKERTGLAGERLIPLLRAVRSDVSTTAPLDDLLRLLETGQLDDVSRQLEALLKAPHRGIIRLGSWVAAAKVAIETGKDPYFNGNPPQHFLKELGTNLTPTARDILGKLDKNKVGNDQAEIRRLLDKLATAI